MATPCRSNPSGRTAGAAAVMRMACHQCGPRLVTASRQPLRRPSPRSRHSQLTPGALDACHRRRLRAWAPARRRKLCARYRPDAGMQQHRWFLPGRAPGRISRTVGGPRPSDGIRLDLARSCRQPAVRKPLGLPTELKAKASTTCPSMGIWPPSLNDLLSIASLSAAAPTVRTMRGRGEGTPVRCRGPRAGERAELDQLRLAEAEDERRDAHYDLRLNHASDRQGHTGNKVASGPRTPAPAPAPTDLRGSRHDPARQHQRNEHQIIDQGRPAGNRGDRSAMPGTHRPRPAPAATRPACRVGRSRNVDPGPVRTSACGQAFWNI